MELFWLSVDITDIFNLLALANTEYLIVYDHFPYFYIKIT